MNQRELSYWHRNVSGFSRIAKVSIKGEASNKNAASKVFLSVSQDIPAGHQRQPIFGYGSSWIIASHQLLNTKQ
jgi:hypothetical protein